MRKIISKVPVTMAGLMLALASTGNLVSSYGVIYKNIFGTLSALLLLLLLTKIAVDFKAVQEELKNPVVAGVAPTLSMGIMILSTYIKPHFETAAFFMWILGIVIHIYLMLLFTMKFILNFDLKKVFPSYFVVYVGIVVVSLTAPVFGAIYLGKLIFWFGFVAYLVLLPIVTFRVFAVKAIPEPALPTLAIFAAPASLCLAGYMNSFQEKNLVMVWILMGLSIFMYLVILMYMPRLLSLKFYPSFSAFTFPFVISAVGLKSTNAFLVKSNSGIPGLNYAVRFQEVVAVGLVIYVLIRYINFLFQMKPSLNLAKPEKTV